MDLTLVTGATGFVGSYLTRRLVGKGTRVRVLVRNPDRLDILGDARADVEIKAGDVTDVESVEHAMEGVNRVYHCAAFVGFGTGSSDLLMTVNVGGTANVVNVAMASGVDRLVHTSSIAALGRPENPKGCLDEETLWVESPLNTDYARSKHLAELEVRRGIAEGLNAVLVNPSLIMGPGRPGENTMQIVEKIRLGRLPAIPSGATNVVDVEDVVEGHLAAMEKGMPGQRYVLAGDNLSWEEIIQGLAAALGVEPPTRRLSLRRALLLGAISEAVSAVTRRPALITRDSARLTGHRTCYENRKAREILGVRFRPFSETAQRLALARDDRAC